MFVETIHEIQLNVNGKNLQGDVIVGFNARNHQMKSLVNVKKTSLRVITSLREHALQRKAA